MMEDFNTETDSDYTSYWRDWDPRCELNPVSRSCLTLPPHVPQIPPSTSLLIHFITAIPGDKPYFRPGLAVWREVKEGELMYSIQFISSRGNEYFCEIDEDYLTDRFNLTGLNTEVTLYQYALELVTDVFDVDCDDDMREQVEKSARHLYGLVHARYIVTTRGLQKMMEKYKKSEFGKCPRVMCGAHPLLPMGQHDTPNTSTVKLYCARCEDLYNPKSTRHASIDGAYFGTSFHNILFQVYPAIMPPKSLRRYEPRIFGFRVHAAAALQRWQDDVREQMQGRLRKVGVEAGFVEEDEEEGESEIEEDEELGGGAMAGEIGGQGLL